MLDKNGNYFLYLRKSRADLDAELRGEGETLARHERILLELAKKLGVTISAIYKEIVSGESIQNRPVMQQVIKEVSSGMWDGCFVVEVERLARGDTQDQGIVAKTFKYSDTLIITPVKTYDPSNEFDEEYFEFGLFMSRREYKTIKRRMQQGRFQSAKEGKWVANQAPFGYSIKKLDKQKGFTLAINQEEADTYQLLMSAAIDGVNGIRLGDAANANRLNSFGLKTRTGKQWTQSAVFTVRTNEVHTGIVVWGRRKQVKKIVDGNVINTRPRAEEYQTSLGLHPALISREEWLKAQHPFSNVRYSVKTSAPTIQSPLAGLIVCGNCGHNMMRRSYTCRGKEATIICTYPNCNTVSSKLYLVENCILDTIKEWVTDYELAPPKNKAPNTVIEPIKKQIKHISEEQITLQKQLDKLYDLLETNVYDTDTFLDRSTLLKKRLQRKNEELTSAKLLLEQAEQQKDHANTFIPLCKTLIDNYQVLSPADKNYLLKELIDHVTYTKYKRSKKGDGDTPTFSLEIFPKLPKR